MMAGTDPQKQLLTLIRDFATEKSQGERRIVGLKKRIQELRSELDLANAELEDTKRLKETAEQDLKGYEVELARNEASIQTLEVRISLIQDEILIAGSDLEALKTSEFEEKIASLGEELQRRCICPSCHVDNAQALNEILQASDRN
ncbi:hypothetical protein Acr_05g0007420 [Actinidia rufa]|uniref:Uncharacterized protein n=1 Tax=Actinidia rufa TaxID=165716 RepID=A0A7J0EKV7_9ERIC|nr:hypothetical protein Acr_05g0007420 [Actinidia rufa]